VRIALLIVFGSLGTLTRYALQGIVQEHTGGTFPSGTLVVNLLGCFLLGGIAEYALGHLTIAPDWRIGITVGFFGAFTTFSSFSWETARLLQGGEWRRASIYVLSSLIGGPVACRRVTITRLRASKLSWPLATKSCSPSNSSPT
jgi:CrcB protein